MLQVKTEIPEHARILECTINNAELVNVREHFSVDIAVINPERPELLNGLNEPQRREIWPDMA